MKYNILTIGAAATLLTAMSSCSENYWNDHELDGFEKPGITDVQSVD